MQVSTFDHYWLKCRPLPYSKIRNESDSDLLEMLMTAVRLAAIQHGVGELPKYQAQTIGRLRDCIAFRMEDCRERDWDF